MSRSGRVAALVAAGLLVGSAVAAAQERPPASRYPDVTIGTDCGCTAATRAKSRVEMGLVPGTSTQQG